MNRPIPKPPPIAAPPMIATVSGWSDGDFRFAVSFFASLILHVTTLVGLAVFMLGKSEVATLTLAAWQAGESQPEMTILNIATTAAPPVAEEIPTDHKLVLSATALNITDISSPPLLDRDAFSETANISVESNSAESRRNAMMTLPVSKRKVPDAVSEQKKGASYYGIHASGKRFVFVVDASTSMTGVRWEHAIKELIDSLKTLPSDAEFYVVFFSNKTQMLFNQNERTRSYQPADFETIKKTQQWIQNVYLGPSTQPHAALRMALLMEPDAVFLLSDGEFRDDTLSWIRSLAAKKKNSSITLCPVHTIGLYSNMGLGTLAEVAERTGGKFRLVRAPF